MIDKLDNLRKFCEENNIECRVDQANDEPVRVRMYHQLSGREFTDVFPSLSNIYIELVIGKAKHMFNLLDVASLYPKFYASPEWAEARMAKLQKRLIAAEMRAKRPEITNVIFSGPATIVFWSDGTKTVVKADGELVDPEKGLAMAIAKKFLGTNKNKSNYYDVFKEWLPEEKPLTIPKLNINWTDESKVVLARLAGGSPDDSLYNLAGKILFRKNVVEEATAKVTYMDIFTEFASNYPDFVDDVTDWRPYGPPYTVETRAMNIVIWMKNGEIKRYSYETKKLYPVEEE